MKAQVGNFQILIPIYLFIYLKSLSIILFMTSLEEYVVNLCKVEIILNFQFYIYDRDAILSNAKQQIKSLETKLDYVNRRHLSDKEAWELNLHNLEETWRCNVSFLTYNFTFFFSLFFFFYPTTPLYLFSENA